MKPLKTLIVEDEAIVAMELEVLVTQLGYDVSSIVDTGEKAIQSVSTEQPDLILMDIRIKGGIDGLETSNIILAEHDIPIVYSTAEIDEAKIQQIGKDIPFSYILKPIRKRDLKIAIDMALHMAEVDRERRRAEEALKLANENLERLVAERTAELSKSNQFLADAKSRAEEANYAKSMFLANISHELRTPMHHILNYSKFGEEKSESATREKLFHYFSQIRKTGNRLLMLLNDLLDLSKLESEHVKYNKRDSDLVRIIDTVIDEFTQSASAREIVFVKDIKTERTALYCDDLRISQVLRNLFSNALRYSPDKTSILVTVERIEEETPQTGLTEGDGFAVSVADRGTGIPEDEITAIFDKFTQSSRTRSKSGGTGLGLSICHEIIQAHLGQISASNRPGGGSVFRFTLPEK